jgi:pimeloyl-ACP methyl ester carboxylesterase
LKTPTADRVRRGSKEIIMLHLRHHAGRSTLRAILLVSASFAVAGGLILAGTADAAPAQAASTAFRSDRLSVEVVGSGPDVILIPGFASSREVWRAEAERLKATHRVHLVQLAGFAGEPWTHGDGPFVQPMADELVRYVREAGLQRPAVIGHSMGGMTGILLAQQHPGLLGRVMSVDSLPFFSALFGPQVTAEVARPFADQTAAGIRGADEAGFRAQQSQSAIGLARDPGIRAAMVEWSMTSDRQAMASAIREVMTTPVVCAEPASDIRRIVRVLLDTRQSALPVVSESYIVLQLRNVGYALSCHELDKFPPNSGLVQELLYTI